MEAGRSEFARIPGGRRSSRAG